MGRLSGFPGGLEKFRALGRGLRRRFGWGSFGVEQCRRHRLLDGLVDRWLYEREESSIASSMESLQQERELPNERPQPTRLPYDIPSGESSVCFLGEDSDAFYHGGTSADEDEFQQQGASLGTGTDARKTDAPGLQQTEDEFLTVPDDFSTESSDEPLSHLDEYIRSLAHRSALEPAERMKPLRFYGRHIKPEDEEEKELLLEAMTDKQIDGELSRVRKLLTPHQFAKVEDIVPVVALGPRRKRVDGKGTVRAMARNGGRFERFRYRDSPTETSVNTTALEVLCIGDVSGSMGRYIATVLHLISALGQLARVTSYVFSDEPTFVSENRPAKSFRKFYENLRQTANSWAYGTRLSLALERIRTEGRYTDETIVVLITDGGFHLVGDDWQKTVSQLSGLRAETARLIVVTPNEELARDGELYVQRVQQMIRRNTPAHDILASAEAVKVARFGVLSLYSDAIVECTKARDIEQILFVMLSGGLIDAKVNRNPL